ncbi:MAG: bifunctional glutamate N-acetyltransferase/amino-acid acetyltransferase ArgJ [Verrucomicrobiota bacterium]
MDSPFVIKSGGVCAATGFQAAAVSCGIKDPSSPKLDLAMIWSDSPSIAAAVFTQNRVKAAPVQLCANYLRADDPQAIIVNSGNANACTGPVGMEHARQMADVTAKSLGIRRRQVMVASTGIIGVPLPIDRILPKIKELPTMNGKKDCRMAAEAIMTSDTVPKSAMVELEIGGKKVSIGAIAKGSGMINPNMATMLCFITTDACISKTELQRATREATDLSFNRITIDGDMSTNDTVIVMANCRAENRRITARGPGSRLFRDALTALMLKMAKKMVADGERVTKLVEVRVNGASSQRDAELVARAVANSSLVKCSWNGNDPNWGRIIHAVGYSGAKIKPELVDIYFDGLCAAKHGIAHHNGISFKELEKVVAKRKFTIGIELNQGRAEYHIYTSDLSPEYVDFNRREYAAPQS